MSVSSKRRAGIGGLVVSVVCLFSLGVSASASLASEPWWGMTTNARPAYLLPEGKGEIVVSVENYGDANANGAQSPIRIADQLPAGLEAKSIVAAETHGIQAGAYIPFPCDLATLTCTDEGSVSPYSELEVRIGVEVKPGVGVGKLANHASVSGGGASTVTIARPVQIGDGEAPFGLEEWDLLPEEEGGGLDARAGSHPFQVTGTFVLRQGADANLTDPERPNVQPIENAKDIITTLPPGLVGDPVPIARCTLGQFLDDIGGARNACAPDSAVGVAAVTLNLVDLGQGTFTVPIFNLEPYAGEPARFGFYIPNGNVPVILDTSVLTNGKYAITVGSTNITQTAALLSVRTTFWGNPASEVHNGSRGWACLLESKNENIGVPCTNPEVTYPPAFLTLPTNCEEQMQASVTLDAWNHAGEEKAVATTDPMLTLDGCNSVPFTPTIEAAPTTTYTASPSGLNFNVNFLNEGLTSTQSDAQSELKETTVVLPPGLTIDPSAGIGLVGCREHQYGEEELQAKSEQEKREGRGCPDEAKLGTVSIETPLLTQKIEGNVFIAQPYENPFAEPPAHPNGTLVALYIVARNPETGVLVKLAGKVTPCEHVGEVIAGRACESPGQLTTTFEENPQLPFSHFNFHFREGAQAPLITPATCGSFETVALLTPWSEPLGVLEDGSSFTLDGNCPAGGAPPFHPGLTAGMLNNNAGSFSELYVNLSRNDAEQEISRFSTVMPPGMSGILKGIPYCPEQAIEAARHKSGAEEEQNPSCPGESQIGKTEVGTGVGQVLAYVPGKIYLAGPFRGAPFSIVSITSAKVGPFDLGTVVLRFGLNIDPQTAQVSVEPTSSEPIPTIIDGIVTHVRDIKVYIDRPNFTINPTSCEKTHLSSTLNAAEGARATVESPYQATNCASLKFEPKVTASVSGKVTKTEGTSFKLNVSKPEGQGEQADIKKFKIELPRPTPLAVDDAAEGVHLGPVRIQPRQLPGRVADRVHESPHPPAPRPRGRTDVLRQPRRRSVPEPRDRPAGRWRHRPLGRADVHLEIRDHVFHVQRAA